MISEEFEDKTFSDEESRIVRELFYKKTKAEMWKHIDSLIPNLPQDKEIEAIFTSKNVVIRIWKF